MHFRNFFVVIITALVCTVAFAQQTGSISGRVTTAGDALPGVTVEARSTVLPQARVTTTEAGGQFRLPQLPPGDYTLTFSLAGMRTETRNVRVLLDQTSTVNVSLGVAAVTETITVMAESPLIDPTSTEIKSTVSQDIIEQVPVGTDYRDLLKLAPGVIYNDAGTTRGPAAGGSEQDNVYQFDGVNITMPLFGVLNTEPSTHDIAQISFTKGGAKAVDFNRAAGFTVDSVSKSGTSEFTGELSFRIQPESLTADPEEGSSRRFDQDRDWSTIGLGGPILRDRLFFYGSYYRPTLHQENVANVYGPVPDLDSTRDEFFGKLTFTPTSNILLHGSYRDSEQTVEGASVGSLGSATTSVGSESTFKIGIVEGSWLLTSRSFATFKLNDYANENTDRPDVLLPQLINRTPGTRLDINNLEQMGQFFVPSPLTNPRNEREVAFNQFIVPLIERYGFIRDGQRVGGGNVGADSEINPQDFFRQSAQVGYDFSFGQTVTHDIHVGYQWFRDEEDLSRISNGWGEITVPGGRVNCPANAGCDGQPVFFQALFIQGTLPEFATRRTIHSEFVSNNIEVNDTIQWNNWAFNVGFLASQDTLYGQGLRNDSSTLSGFVLSPGTKYKMYEIDWDKQIQPRLGATWAYNGVDTVYASYARYNPQASSLPRAAAWDRNATGLRIEAYFDAEGKLIGSAPRGSSSGKLFVPDLDPRYTDEFLLGTARQFNNRWAGRAYGRYRYSTNFWEDTNNNARVAFEPPEGIPRELYIPNLDEQRRQIGSGSLSGSSYVIAELDGAYTKYYEATLESDWRATDQVFLRGSYTWSHYYGTFDQDNTTGVGVLDFVNFIGSSNLADGAGRQIWDNKYGDLRSDRRNLLKVYGYYTLPWRATAGAFAVYQSGHHWEAWDYRPYSHLTTSTSVTNRYAEPAGSRETDPHYQLDLNYTQNVPIAGFNLQLEVDLFNLFDKQTGYNPVQNLNSSVFGESQSFYSPRQFQIGARFQF